VTLPPYSNKKNLKIFEAVAAAESAAQKYLNFEAVVAQGLKMWWLIG
jgi:hypothetical protein